VNDNSSQSPAPERLSWLRRWGLTVAWMLAIFIATSIPNNGGGPGKGIDKIHHLLAYVVLAVLAHRSWSLSRSAPQTKLGLAGPLATAGGWALFDELHQLAIPTRDFDLLDLAADAAGIMVGLFLASCWQHRRRNQASRL